jgi:anti-sigma B factor antagonist
MGMDASDQFRVAVSRDGERVIVELAGEFDLYGAEQFTEHLASLASAHTVEVRAADVSFIDSGGLRALLTARETTRERGAEFRITALSSQVTRVAEVAGVADLLVVEP